MEFENKVVVVTGAAGVFGRWICEAFWREGAKVCLSDMRDEAARDVASANGIGADRALVHHTNLADPASILDLVATLDRAWGSPDIVVNNAGVYPKGGLLDIPVEEWNRIFDLNLRAPFLVSREMAKLMIRDGKKGSIVNISSGAARQMRNGTAPYCTSKTALERISKGFALELAHHGIRVNVVEPGFAPGSVVSPLPQDYVDKMIARIPLGRASGPGDAPGAIMYLSSEKAGFITGAVLSVDGGNSIGTYEPGQLGQGR